MTERDGLTLERFAQMRAEWVATTRLPSATPERFLDVKLEADRLINAGHWTSGPADMLSVLGRQRDELTHSRLLAWLLVPTNRHGLGRAFLTRFLDVVWPDEALMRTGPVSVEAEVNGAGLDDTGKLREARADIVLHGDGLTILIENKLDAGEQPSQCDRQYWAWASEPGETRWVFLSPTGRSPTTATPGVVADAWRSMSYSQVRDVIQAALDASGSGTAAGRVTATQYLTTLTGAVTL